MPIIVIIATLLTIVVISRQKLISTKELEETSKEDIQNTEAITQVAGEGVQKTEENIQATEENSKDTNEQENIEWKIEIPEISLIANISEGTDNETLSKFVGHFSSTPKEEGNIGVAAHNRGYAVNYFENLKNLKGGEEIIYTYGEFAKTYVVTQNIKISDTDWSYLENSNENKITLITCIENEPEYRRCVQAIEKEE